ncbi:BglG family transcription antiterminator [Candidatus Enterococcus willemsii]|uniref:BglG family transcription antiterminator n=1 Tax=Candidatus Enterococcus willemsii TaxID=1857215 RepID=UPI001F3ABE33|nr:BglG family transcription antiterminator [Enterococcus sp. CU12B]
MNNLYFSNREKQILKLLVEYTEGITPQELQTQLQISKRTLYREISSIEKSLKPLEIQIVKPRGKGYQLVGEAKKIADIKQVIQKDKQMPIDNVHRQSALASNLLLADEEQTIEGLAIDFDVSPSTIHNDLQLVEESLKDYSLTLERRKARGIIITGGEYERRQILGNTIYSGVSEYEFFHYLSSLTATMTEAMTTNFFLRLITPQAFYIAKTVILDKRNKLFLEVTDNQIQQVITILALSIDRVKTNHLLNNSFNKSQISAEIYALAEQIMTNVTEHGVVMPEEEYLFFARQLEGVNYKKPQNIFLESFDVALSYQVREVIRIVSEEMQIDFRVDDVLYYDLLTHLSAAFKRMNNLVQLANNPLLDKIVVQYEALTQAIQSALSNQFPDEQFSTNELAYIVIHFAASLERHPTKKAISTLVLCSSGIGTAKILESRLRKYIPEIDHIQIIKISQMSHVDYKKFDLILSTIFLPDFTLPYKLISPLLLDDEVQRLKQEIADKRFESKSAEPVIVAKESEGSFDYVYDLMKVGNDLLTQFDIKSIQTDKTLEATIQQIMEGLEGVIVEDALKVSERVLRRHQTAPIGIPGTNLALFHSSNPYVKAPYFSIFDLTSPIPVLGMDKRPMALSRVLLMLAPEPMTPVEEKLLGLISASIIESDLNMEIYQNETKEVIYELISSLFVNEIREAEEEK